MRTRSILGMAVVAALAAAALSATPASAATATFANPMATASTTDFDISTVDVAYTATELTITLHTQNFVGAGFSGQVLALDRTITSGGAGKAYGLSAEYDGVTTALEGGAYVDGTNSTFAAPAGSSFTRNGSNNTFTAVIPSSQIPFSGPVYVAAIISDDGSTSAAAAVSLSSTVAGLGPVTRDAAPTTTTVALTSPTQVYGSTPAAIVATVTPAAAGTVQIVEGAVVVASGATTNGIAVVSLPTALTSGPHTFVARFVPADPANFASSTSAPFAFSVISAAKATKTTVSLSKKSQTFKKKSTAKVKVVVSEKAVGSVAIYDGKKLLKTVTLKKGKATYTLSKSLKKGKHKIKAVFTPADIEAFAPSTSKTVTLTVKK